MTCADGKVVVQAQNDKPYTIRMVNRHVKDVQGAEVTYDGADSVLTPTEGKIRFVM